MKINFDSYADTDVEKWAIVTAVTKSGVIDRINPANMDITLLVDGVEIDFIDFIVHMHDMMKHDISEQARQIVRNKIGDIYDELGEIEEYAVGVINGIDWEA